MQWSAKRNRLISHNYFKDGLKNGLLKNKRFGQYKFHQLERFPFIPVRIRMI